MPTFEQILKAQGTDFETVLQGLRPENFGGASLDVERQGVLLRAIQPLFDENFRGMTGIPAPAGVLLFCQQHAGDVSSQAKVVQALITKKILASKTRRPAQEVRVEVTPALDVPTPSDIAETSSRSDKQAVITKILDADLAEGYAANDEKLRQHLDDGHAANLRVLEHDREEGLAALDAEFEARRAEAEEDVSDLVGSILLRELAAADQKVEARAAELLAAKLEEGLAGIAHTVAKETDIARDAAMAEMLSDVAREKARILQSLTAISAAVETGRASLSGGVQALFAEFSRTMLNAEQAIAEIAEIETVTPAIEDAADFEASDDADADALRNDGVEGEDGVEDADVPVGSAEHADKGLSEAGSEVAGRTSAVNPEAAAAEAKVIVNIFEGVYKEKGLKPSQIERHSPGDIETSRLLAIEGIDSYPNLRSRSETGPYLIPKATHAALKKTATGLGINAEVHTGRFKALPSIRPAVASASPAAAGGVEQDAAVGWAPAGVVAVVPPRAPKATEEPKREYRNFGEVVLDGLTPRERNYLRRFVEKVEEAGITNLRDPAQRAQIAALVVNIDKKRGRGGRLIAGDVLRDLGVLKGGKPIKGAPQFDVRDDYIGHHQATKEWFAAQGKSPKEVTHRATHDSVLRSPIVV